MPAEFGSEEWDSHAEPVDVSITLLTDLVHQCPFVDEIDIGFLRIEYTPGERLAELHDLARHLQSWAEVEITSEAITKAIFDWFNDNFAPSSLLVETKWVTAGIDITVTAR